MNCQSFENVVNDLAREQLIEAALREEALHHGDACSLGRHFVVVLRALTRIRPRNDPRSDHQRSQLTSLIVPAARDVAVLRPLRSIRWLIRVNDDEKIVDRLHAHRLTTKVVFGHRAP